MGHTGLAATAHLLGDRSRVAMLDLLLDGRAHTAGELGRAAGIAPATTAKHLARLEDGGLIVSARRGRERLCSLRGPDVAAALEAIAVLAPAEPPRTLRQATRMELLRRGRTCYDHLAGRLGVALAEVALSGGAIVTNGAGPTLTPAGRRWLEPLSLDLDGLQHARRPFLRTCLDWTERREHLAGGLGAALCTRMLELGWIRRREGSRAVAVTERGAKGLARLGVTAEGELEGSRA